MSRSSYDDMPDSRMNNRYSGNRGKTGLIAIAGILIALLCIILFLIFTPSDKIEKEEEAAVRAAENTEVSIPEISIPEPVAIEEPKVIETDSNRLKWQSYIWKTDDDIKSVAGLFDLSPDTLIQVNDISDISNIQAGAVLRVPSIDGIAYIVNPSDTISSVISKYNPLLSEKELKELNGIDELRAGDEIFIPTEKDNGIAASLISFSMPIDGNKIISYGEYYEGYKIDGIVYSAKAGTPVKAAFDGFVVDAGINPLYGKFVSIMHEGGYKTSYFALESVDVVTGQNIEKGSVIGSVGSSNMYFKTPALLFKVDQSGIKINPELVIK